MAYPVFWDQCDPFNAFFQGLSTCFHMKMTHKASKQHRSADARTFQKVPLLLTGTPPSPTLATQVLLRRGLIYDPVLGPLASRYHSVPHHN